ncbi:Homeobox domain-containing protein [Caenorhabditis elegans]|uniref:Homeobox domain-containing protein n=1 Tax=Caenorhabditis elegans TaxID=6239 RepID=Q18764_CAEEL|nr:Homeobox domain-containing protein [Caenorhabditis elegans]CAA98254.2 Homeobox domain-containing protein [Caenorhabditis elegans]|eukprot:NP_505554.2 C. Elegans Homeobox [Caenorhabditis elegans]
MASLAKSIVLTAIGEGRVSVDKIKAFIPRVPMNDLFRLKCEMAVALREARPQDVLMMSENLQASEDDLTFINNMIKCAHNQISMDNAFLALGLVPPLPATFCSAASIDNNAVKSCKNKSTTLHAKILLSKEVRFQLTMKFERNCGVFSKAEIQTLAEKYNMTCKQIKQYFRNLRFRSKGHDSMKMSSK